MPARASRWPIWAELVSTTWPSRSSVPTATTSQRTDDPATARHLRETGLEIGAGGALDRDRGEGADREVSGHAHDAVDLRCLAVGAAHARLVDQHVDRSTDQAGPPGGGDAVLALAQLEQPF